jgi:hypothetical protein
MIAVNNGTNRCVYAGPVMSHYEFTVEGAPQRLSDSEWQIRWARAGFADPSVAELNPYRGSDRSQIPSRPDWTEDFLVPRK